MAEVFCMGVLVADLTAGPVLEYPQKGKMALVDRMQLSIGGCAANTALVLSKLGMQTALASRVGEDDLGDFLIDSLTKQGVAASYICRDKKFSTGCSVVLNSPDGERSFITSLGANNSFGEADLDWEAIKNAKLIHVGGALLLPAFDGKPAAEVMQRAKKLGLSTCLDTAWDSSGRWWEGVADCLPYTDLFLPSLVEAEMLTGKSDVREISRMLLDAGVKVVGLKMGERGSFVCTKDSEIAAAPFQVNAIDANGAGDAYVAGFIAGWLKKMPLAEIARVANAVGAMATTAVGPADGVAGFEEVLRFIKENTVAAK